MKTLKKYEAYLDVARKWYIISFITYLLLSRVVMFVNIISLPVNGIMYNLFAMAGVAILVWDFFTNFHQFKSIENIILLVFLGVCGISSILNMEYGFANNLKTLVWMAIQFFILYSTLHVKDKSYIKNMLQTIMKLTTSIWFVTTVISLFQFLFIIKYKAPFSSYARRQGFIDSRLFGVYSDPNFAAVTSVIVIIFALFICKNTTSKKYRRFQIANIICQMLYIILSGSRTGQIVLIFILCMLAVVFVRNKYISQKKNRYCLRALVTAAIVGVVAILGIKVLPQPLIMVAKLGEGIKKEIIHKDTHTGVNDDEEEEDDNEEEDDDEEINLDREDVKEDNISNNRFQIWSSAIEVSGSSRLFGVSPRNLVPYAQANYPESYIATSGYETHNGYVAVFVYTGIAGTVVMLAFVGYMLYLFVKYLIASKNKKYGDEIVISLSVVIVIAISSFMLLDIFFVNTVSAALFWLTAGYFTYIAKREAGIGLESKDK